MAFHVEIKSGFQHARAFNLDESRLRREVLEPWLANRIILLGDQEWEPKDCSLKILEGPELAAADLGMGRGWDKAEKVSENVTRRLVSEAATPSVRVAVIADTDSANEGARLMLGQLQIEPVDWTEMRARILSQGGNPTPGDSTRYAAVLAIESAEPPPAWLFDAGLARGALGGRAVFAQFGEGPIPPQLAGVDVMRLEPADQTSLGALRQRLGG